MAPFDPTRVPVIDSAELARHRPAYRWLSYVLARSTNKARADLPGVDRPPSASAVRHAQAAWLAVQEP